MSAVADKAVVESVAALDAAMVAQEQKAAELGVRRAQIRAMGHPNSLTPALRQELEQIAFAVVEINSAHKTYNLVKIMRLNSSSYVSGLAASIAGVNSKLAERLRQVNEIVAVVKNVAAFLGTLDSFLKALQRLFKLLP